MKRAKKAGKMKRMRPTKVWAAVELGGHVIGVRLTKKAITDWIDGTPIRCIGPITIQEPRAVARARGGRG